MKAACDSALKKIPNGSLFGAIHCAAIAPGRPWTKSMTEKLDVSFEQCRLEETNGSRIC